MMVPTCALVVHDPSDITGLHSMIEHSDGLFSVLIGFTANNKFRILCLLNKRTATVINKVTELLLETGSEVILMGMVGHAIDLVDDLPTTDWIQEP